MSQSTNSPSPENINEMVVLFYHRIRAHQRLGPIFAREITADWDQHIETMQKFWRSVLLKAREYRGRPVPAHAKIQGITTDDFEKWLALFQETTLEVFDPAQLKSRC